MIASNCLVFNLMRLHKSLKFVLIFLLLAALSAAAQQTNPVDKQVSNPLTDTPNVNPVAPEQDIKAPKRKQPTDGGQPAGDDEVSVDYGRVTAEGEEGSASAFIRKMLTCITAFTACKPTKLRSMKLKDEWLPRAASFLTRAKTSA